MRRDALFVIARRDATTCGVGVVVFTVIRPGGTEQRMMT
jgi:hypothetical protein